MTIIEELGFSGKFSDLSEEQKKIYRSESYKRYFQRNKDKRRKYMISYLKKYYQKNKDRFKERAKRPDVRERKNKCDAIYRSKNRERNRIYMRLKRKNDPQHRAGVSIRTRLHALIGRSNRIFSKSLGLSKRDLVIHLESKFLPGMTWENYGNGWHIDHIIPCSAFDLTNPEHVKFCFSLSNLQPLWAKDNISKSDKIPEGVVIPFEIKAV